MSNPPVPHDRSADLEIVRLAIRKGWLSEAQAAEAFAVQAAGGALVIAALTSAGTLDAARLRSLREEVASGDRPQVLGGYLVSEVLGQGGMGVVYRARELASGREVALKVLSPHFALDPVFRARFLREVHSAGRFDHPHLIACLGSGEADQRLYLAMELAAGGDAESLALRSGGRLAERRAVAICCDAARGLEALHAAGLMHRDIKPANLFLDQDGRARLGDFGLVRAVSGAESRLTHTGNAVGTPGFMSPEQAENRPDLDIRADIYALGASLFHLLTGRPPFVGNSPWMVVSQALAGPLPDPRDLVAGCSAGVAAVVRHAGALRREQRYAEPRLLREDLERLLAGQAPLHAAMAGGEPDAAGGDDPVSRAARSKRILIVDDDPMVRRIYESMFTGGGYEVASAHDGPSGLAAIAAFRPSIVLLDLLLPGMDGAQVMRAVRERDGANAPLIVVFTNAYFEAELLAAREAGADLIISKVAYSPRQVVEAVDKVLAAARSTGRLAQSEGRQRTSAQIDCATRASAALGDAREMLRTLLQARSGRGGLVRTADLLRPLAALAAAAAMPGAASLCASLESLARQLHEWPDHLNPSSLRTLRVGIDALERSLRDGMSIDIRLLSALVVDDDPISRRVVCQALARVGIAAREAADAGAAIAILGEHPIALILSDVMMAGLDGFQFAGRVRAMPAHVLTPFIFVTGLNDFEQSFRASARGADDAIAKPFLVMELAAKALSHVLAPGIAAGAGERTFGGD